MSALSSLKIPELKKKLAEAKLPTIGVKATLVKRLQDYLKERQELNSTPTNSTGSDSTTVDDSSADDDNSTMNNSRSQEDDSAADADTRVFLQSVGLLDLSNIFQTEKITMDVMMEMTHESLKDIGITAFGDRHKILRGIRDLGSIPTHKNMSGVASSPKQTRATLQQEESVLIPSHPPRRSFTPQPAPRFHRLPPPVPPRRSVIQQNADEDVTSVATGGHLSQPFTGISQPTVQTTGCFMHQPTLQTTQIIQHSAETAHHPAALISDQVTLQPTETIFSKIQNTEDIKWQPTGRTMPATQSMAINSPTMSTSPMTQHTPPPSQLMETIACFNALSQIPTPTPTVFSGDPLEFMDWRFSFRTLIQNKGIPSQDRIFYLKQYVSGKARESISGHFYNHTDAGFQEAMATLEKRFGDPLIISEAFRQKLSKWPRIKEMSGEHVMKLSDYVRHISSCMETMPGLEALNDSHEVKRVVELLPRPMITRWNRHAYDYRQDRGKYPSFSDVANFISSEANLLVDPYSVTSTERKTETNAKGHNDRRHDRIENHKSWKATTARTQTDMPTVQIKKEPCSYCNRNHPLTRCFKFRDQCSYEKKIEFIKEKGLCFGCLIATHRSKFCQQREKCDECGKSHPTILHQNNFVPAKSNKNSHLEQSTEGNTRTGSQGTSSPSTACTSQQPQHTATTHSASGDNICEMSSMIVPVWITSNTDQNKRLLTYALLDSQSDTTFITDEAAANLGAQGPSTSLSIRTVTDSAGKLVHCRKYTGLTIASYQSPSVSVNLPACFSKQHIPMNIDHIPSPERAGKCPHLRRIAREIPPRLDIDVGILIGYNCPNALRPMEIITGKEDEPFAVKTTLGWTIVGSAQIPAEDCITHRIINKPVLMPLPNETGRQEVKYVQRTHCREVSPYDALRCLEKDFLSNEEDLMMSQEDFRFLDLLEVNTFQQQDGHYNMPLPFRAPPQLRNNRSMAVRRFAQTQRKMRLDQVYNAKYREFMSSIIERGEAERVPDDQVFKTDAWYIPHHAVFHPQKPGKLRVVFDCSASDGRRSLNSCLMPGPDLNNQLLGVLLRFRLDPVAIMCDIQRMYHQFRVSEADRDYLRFVWSDDQEKLSDYRMAVHLFGATSSPNCAKFGLRKIATDHGEQAPKAQRFILRNFYVDDGLASLETEDEAIELLRDTQAICAKGNLKLHKIVSNKRNVLHAVPPSDRLVDTSLIDLHDGILPPERALGVYWNTESDEFSFKVNTQTKPFTKRGMLSAVSSIYDPLGLIAPVILEGKLLLQSSCNSGKWDDPLPEQLKTQWENWQAQLQYLPDIMVCRCIKPPDFGNVVKTELHHFADASTKGYCVVSYIRLMNDEEQISCRMLMGKSRVAPSKIQTIPRLELQAAVLSTEIAKLLRKELNITAEEFFWTDSTIVLNYIKNEAKRFNTFVANRVQKISNNSNINSWHHVETTKNPADIGSRGSSPTDLMKSSWFNGPEFLHQKQPYTSPVKVTAILDADDPEVRKTANTLITESSQERMLLNRVEKFSDWNKILAAVSFLLTTIRKKTKQPLLSPLQTRRLAEVRILKLLQTEHYKDVLTRPDQKNQLSSLCPFVADDGLLRVGGRLTNSTTINYGVKHPIILPKYSHVTELIIRHVHDSIHHQGRSMTLNALRSNGYWVVGCSSAVKSFLRKCVTCRKHRILDPVQKMADLPRCRVEPAPPFLFSGIDCFGPFFAKDGRKESKRYGLMVTCLASRAVHLELLEDMSTDSLINGLRNTMSIRGYIQEIRCDNGSNFIGAHNELSKELRLVEMSRIKNHMLKIKTDFIFNPPHASNFGGVWERMILSARRILNVILARSSSRLSTASLRTVLYEVMSILNSRPLAPTGPTDLEPITPNHLLTGKTHVMTAPGFFESDDLYSRKQWRKVQSIADEFWKRWEVEYLNLLQSRKKWSKAQRNLSIGDVVVLKEDDKPRNLWRLGMVAAISQGSDNLVRKVIVRLADGTELDRPSSGVVLLVAGDG